MSSLHHPTLRLLADRLLDASEKYGVTSDEVDLVMIKKISSSGKPITSTNKSKVKIYYKNQVYMLNYDRLSYSAEYFLQREPKDFVIQCYLSLLKRLPDEGGLKFYLEALSSGRMSKMDSLRRMSSSDESKRIGVNFTPPLPKKPVKPRRKNPLAIVLGLSETATQRVKKALKSSG